MDREITINTKNISLPASVTAVLQETGSDDYIIFLNGDKTDEERAAGFLHECLHIYHKDFMQLDNVDAVERARHDELLQIVKLLEQEAKQK